jgi:glutamyl-tRNA synthetase
MASLNHPGGSDLALPSLLLAELLSQSRIISTFSKKELHSVLNDIRRTKSHLASRSYLAGNSLSVLDLLVWKNIRDNPIAHSNVTNSCTPVASWYRDIEVICPWISKIVTEATGENGIVRYNIDFPSTPVPVVTRFLPTSNVCSGYLTIRHAKMAFINDYFAHKRPGGTLVCRFDDLDPTKVFAEQTTLRDLESIGITPDRITYASDHFSIIYEYAVKLIEAGKAFADDYLSGKTRKSDSDGFFRISSNCSNLSVQESLYRFEQMKSGSLVLR